MTDVRKAAGLPPHASEAADARTRLKKAARDLEAVFVNELFKAMRATAPSQGILTQDSGQEVFTGMLDEHLSQIEAERADSTLSRALYRQLSRRLPDPEPVQGAP